MNLFADTIAPVRRLNTAELFLVRIVAKPFPENPEAREFGGAYVNCWVDADELRVAETRTLEVIESEAWRPAKFDHWELVSRRFYFENSSLNEDERSEFLNRVDEAFQFGISSVFNTWPLDAPDA